MWSAATKYGEIRSAVASWELSGGSIPLAIAKYLVLSALWSPEDNGKFSFTKFSPFSLKVFRHPNNTGHL